MLSIQSLPSYFIYHDFIRVKIWYVKSYTSIGQPLTGEYMNTNVEVSLYDYVKMINTYKCNDEMFTLIGKLQNIECLFMKCSLKDFIKSDIRNLTYFSHDVKTWNISELLKKHNISNTVIENIIPIHRESQTLYQKLLNIIVPMYDCIIDVENLDTHKCNQIFALMHLDV